MSDIRAIVAGRGINVGDGAYHERAEQPHSQLEETLRAWAARTSITSSRRANEFLQQSIRLAAELREKDQQALKLKLQSNG